MDENLLKVARERPFYVRKDKNPEFYSSINRDTHFLTKHSMMDYSLLVGIDTDTDDLVLVMVIKYNSVMRKAEWNQFKTAFSLKSSKEGEFKIPYSFSDSFHCSRFVTWYLGHPRRILLRVSGVAKLFCLRAKFENHFSSGAAPFKISYDFCESFEVEFFWAFLMLIDETCMYVQILY